MTVSYCFRHFNADGGLLHFHLAPCASDEDAIQTAIAEPVPYGCTVLEVTCQNRLVWRETCARTPADRYSQAA